MPPSEPVPDTKRKLFYCGDPTAHRHHAECVMCKSCVSVESGHRFRDTLSFQEFQITKMCQACQDDFWGGDDDE